MLPDERHLKDIQKNLEQKNGEEMRPGLVRRDQNNDFLVQKAEKLTIAIYLITNFLDSREPFKWVMRERALSLMSFMI